MAEVPCRAVIQHVVGDIEFLNDLHEIVRRDLDRIGHHVVVGIEQMIPFAAGQGFDAAGEDITHRRIAYLRTETDKDPVLDLIRIAYKGVVTDQRAETVRKDNIVRP